MTLLFRKSDGGELFLEVWEKAKEKNTGFSISEINTKSFGSEVFGQALRESEATDFQLRFDPDFFDNNYDQIINSHETLATYDTIIYLIKAALGQGTLVTFETTKPGHLIVKIQEQSDRSSLKTIGGDSIVAMDGAGGVNTIIAKSTTSEYTLNQVSEMLVSIEAAGVFVEYEFIGG